MENNDYKKWCNLFVFLNVLKEHRPISIDMFLRLSKRFNIEPDTLYTIIQFYSFNTHKNGKAK